jgi:archaellum biogenesis ATPase FlaH
MKIKVIKHQVRDNLVAVSSDIYKMLNRKGEPRDYLNNLLNNRAEIVEDKWLQDMTIVVPDRKYFDKKIDTTLNNLKRFEELYLGGKW